MASLHGFSQKTRHIKFFSRCLTHLSHHYESLDLSRMTMLYFCVVGLDLLGGLEEVVDDGSPNGGFRARIIEWIYNSQITSNDGAYSSRHCGFRGGPYFGRPFQSLCEEDKALREGDCDVDHCDKRRSGSAPIHITHEFDHSHIAMTYSALAALLTLGDSLERVDRPGIVHAIAALQREDGSFTATSDGSECDTRFLYCACAISAILNDWSGVDCDRAEGYARNCLCYDGGFGLVPGQESHGGSTFTATASLRLMGRLSTFEHFRIRDLEQWCLRRQVTSLDGIGGFQGRCNKDADTCYSFWIGGTLAMIGSATFIDTER